MPTRHALNFFPAQFLRYCLIALFALQSIVHAEGGGQPARCDTDGDGVPDAPWKCDDVAPAGNESCWTCDNNGDGVIDGCKPCLNAEGTKICPPCKNKWDDALPTICYSPQCGVNSAGRATKCWHHGFTDYDDLVDNCPGTLQQKANYTPTSNGCGGAGSTITIPNNPCGLAGTSFLSACDTHDYGYGTCGMSKSNIDGQFYLDMLAICAPFEGQPCVNDPYLQETCRTVAQIYASAVDTYGGPFYEAGQFAACVCCQ